MYTIYFYISISHIYVFPIKFFGYVLGHIIREQCFVLCGHTIVLTMLQVHSFSSN